MLLRWINHGILKLTPVCVMVSSQLHVSMCSYASVQLLVIKTKKQRKKETNKQLFTNKKTTTTTTAAKQSFKLRSQSTHLLAATVTSYVC